MNVELFSLWLPILVNSVALFFASFLAWAVLPHHKKDWKPFPDEQAFINAIKPLGLSRGVYSFPHCADHKQSKDPEFQKKWKEGPMGVLNVWTMPNMGFNMALTFLVFLIASVFIAYVGAAALPRGTDYLKVFQVTGAMAIAVFTIASLPNAIWFQKPARAVCMDLIDGIAYGLITAGIFGSMWPGVSHPA